MSRRIHVAAATLTLFSVLMMAPAGAQERILESPYGYRHYGRGIFRAESGTTFGFKRDVSHGPREIRINNGDEVALHLDLEAGRFQPRYLDLEAGPYKIRMTIAGDRLVKKADAPSTYSVRGADLKPRQNFDFEIELQSEEVPFLAQDRAARIQRCLLGGRFYQVYDRRYRIQSAVVRISDPGQSPPLAEFRTSRTRVKQDVARQATTCSANPINPLPVQPVNESPVAVTSSRGVPPPPPAKVIIINAETPASR